MTTQHFIHFSQQPTTHTEHVQGGVYCEDQQTAADRLVWPLSGLTH